MRTSGEEMGRESRLDEVGNTIGNKERKKEKTMKYLSRKE